MNRNRPCPCGSGKRYKHCCGAEGAPAPAAAADTPPPDPAAALHAALAAQQQGRLAQAEALYQSVLRVQPDHFDAAHMLGVVKLQLERFDDAARLLLGALPRVPDTMQQHFRHNLALCLLRLAEERGVAEALAQEPPPLAQPTLFLRAYAIPGGADPTPRERVSVIVTDVEAPAALARTLASVRVAAAECATFAVDVTAVSSRNLPARDAIRAVVDAAGLQARLIELADAAPVAQIESAAGDAAGDLLCTLRAGDRWAPRWLAWMTAALRARDTRWGCSGVRVEADDGAIVRFGASPDTDALLRAQDALYRHRAGSLAFVGYDPIARGRNLIVRRALWRERGGFAHGGEDALLDWAWRTAQREEPFYLDEPAYLIPPGTESFHLHGMPMPVPGTHSEAGADASIAAALPNRRLRHAVAAHWARQWQLLRALKGSTMSAEALEGCAAMLGLASDDAVRQRPPLAA